MCMTLDVYRTPAVMTEAESVELSVPPIALETQIKKDAQSPVLQSKKGTPTASVPPTLEPLNRMRYAYRRPQK